MPMMRIRKMRVTMPQPSMAVRMRVRLGTVLARVAMLVVLVMDVVMLMLQRLVIILAHVPLTQCKPGAAGGE